jgi:choline dehydrogenase-like flavoprotein
MSNLSPSLPGVLEPPTNDITYDIAIIGSGMGGATVAYALRQSGATVVVVERGDFLPYEYENWSAEAVFGQARYRNSDYWYDEQGTSFHPGVHYYVGGNTKVYGATLPRFREVDFGSIQHPDGISPAWPISYADIEPYYADAERLYSVHGTAGQDPTEPWRSGAYPYPGVPHEPAIGALAEGMRKQGLQPFEMPLGIDLRPGGACIRCHTCDGFPCLLDAKSDAEVCALRPALASGNVELLTRTLVTQLHTGPDGRRVIKAMALRDGRELCIRADRFVLACGAVNTAALLLRSPSTHERGLANASGQVGRNYMVHNSTFLAAVDPRRHNDIVFQKTLGMNDWYLGSEMHYPLGNVQTLGKLHTPMVKKAYPGVPAWLLEFMTKRSIDLYLTSEDLPTAKNRITLDSHGNIIVHWRGNNLASHRELVARTTQVVRRAGYPLIFTQQGQIDTNSHQCGTVVMGSNPATSVLDPHCKAHEVDNLWVADSSSFPSSAAVNPGLTVAANALRVAAGGVGA